MVVRQAINILCIIVYILSFWFDTTLLGYSNGSCLINRITYMFAHTGLLHLIFNLISLNVLWRAIKRMKYIQSGIVVSFLAAFAATYFSEYNIPTVGLSGVCFGMLGVLTIFCFRNKEYMITLAVISVMQIICYFFTASNVLNHAYSFAFALIMGICAHKIELKVNDSKYERQRTKKV